MKLFEKTGKMAIGSRLRLLTSKITDDSALLYGLYNIELTPKWFPVFFVLSDNASMTITEIAQQIGHSQPSVTKIVKEMARSGLVKSNLKSTDKRRNVVGLTTKGKELSQKIHLQYQDVDAAIENIEKEASYPLWEAIAEWEFLLGQKSLFLRVKEQKKRRESRDVKIISYTPKYKAVFRALNEAWINQYFEMEEADYKALDNPELILKKGGKILVALYNGKPVGVCALIKMTDTDYDFEMAKMAVSPEAQGKHIGWLLGKAIVKAAKEAGASKLYLESNTRLTPAINLYYKLGFVKVTGIHSPYKRANIHMELDLKAK
ncbi:bifunctional helix-turn-helix transcriptional regulator/GNAT family N-acetyltransferase [Arachidicoccus terrestris]|uniref:bifunctional helix-turn-helix transcriptional regulator/GNAT family N-acetyltransferase n=1 Tax=Arachidicoccus terrestris TaxID=2875539 RepID=UPI001CC3867A|nr:GNAT family N-acetyltransferase [Arachidicoccus terrestris]UAY56504.1 helix-turn-helix domain-containing GNAT family N-acetyltransferase [Arachidicoccus terrestris]